MSLSPRYGRPPPPSPPPRGFDKCVISPLDGCGAGPCNLDTSSCHIMSDVKSSLSLSLFQHALTPHNLGGHTGIVRGREGFTEERETKRDRARADAFDIQLQRGG
jgi:hypothetical protein